MANYKMIALPLAMLAAVVLLYVFLMPKQADCPAGASWCSDFVENLKETCTPSVSIVEGGNSTNPIRLRVTVAKDGDNCITTEEVIEDSGSGFAPRNMSGYNATCNLTAEEMAAYGARACPGSIFDFVVVSGGGGGGGGGGSKGFGGGTPKSEPPRIYCAVGDEQCVDAVSNLIGNCSDSEIEASEIIAYS